MKKINLWLILIIMLLIITLVVGWRLVGDLPRVLITNHIAEKAEMMKDIRKLEEVVFKNKNHKMTVSFYVPTLGGINSSGNSNYTAVMDKPVAGYTAAVSRDQVYLLFRTVYIPNIGIRYINDLMAEFNPYTGKRITKQIDLCVGSLKDIPKQGIFKNVTVAVKWLDG